MNNKSMHVVLLKFSTNKAKASELMEAHKSWLRKGFNEGVFLLAGSLEPGLGGAIFAHNSSRSELERRVAEDPFVAEKVVQPEILEISPGRADERLQFLLDQSQA